MPATFTRTPVETERKDPGFGGKPPVARRPTGGGGDGENWDNRPPGRRGPRDLLSRYRMFLFFALASDLMFFIALVSAFFARQTSGHFTANNIWVIDWRPVAIPPILWINTAVILLSSFTMEIGRRHFFREIDVMEEWLGLGRPTIRRAAPWLAATAALGGLFLGGQWVAWKQLVAQRVFFASNPSSHFF
jgi:cytochrome c oxidase subunit 3